MKSVYQPKFGWPSRTLQRRILHRLTVAAALTAIALGAIALPGTATAKKFVFANTS